jgi:DNA-binding response OmpR family regulator
MAEQSDKEDVPESESAEEVAPKPESFHVLVVEDEENVRSVLCDSIAFEGYRVSGAAGGHEALDILGKESIDLVLTDLMMPKMNGWQLLEAVKGQDENILVVIITGYLSEQGEAILTNRQVDGYLSKPIDHRRLQILLKALLFAKNLGRAAEVVAVDDDPDILEAIDQVLGKRGIYVKRFEDAHEAQQYIRKTPPDLAIVDLVMPGMDGFELCELIRADSDTAMMPVLILSAQPSRENVDRAVALSANGFIAKPFEPGAFGDRVVKVLRQAVARAGEA